LSGFEVDVGVLTALNGADAGCASITTGWLSRVTGFTVVDEQEETCQAKKKMLTNMDKLSLMERIFSLIYAHCSCRWVFTFGRPILNRFTFLIIQQCCNNHLNTVTAVSFQKAMK